MDNSIEYNVVEPDAALAGLVENFWMLRNGAEEPREIVVLPDGRVDLFFSYSPDEAFEARLMGLAAEPDVAVLAPGMVTFAVSFKLPALEYVLKMPIAALFNGTCALPDGFWDVSKDDLQDLSVFSQLVSQKIADCVQGAIDPRKQALFDALYASRGELTVQALADTAGWSSRQINRYFTSRFGLSLKAYCSILRFRASFGHIKEGKFFPEQNFADQPHFIREIKRFSGVNPKILFKNKDDRFIQFSLLRGQ